MSVVLTSRFPRVVAPLLRQSSAASSSASASSSSSSSLYAVRQASFSSSSCSSASASLLVQVTSRYSLRISFALPRLPSLFDTNPHPPSSLSLASESASSSPWRTDDGDAESDPLNWDGFLNAVPKKKVSHSRKRMRAANKGLKDRVDLVHCQACGAPKLAHHICASCYGDIARRQKEEIRQRLSAPMGEKGRQQELGTPTTSQL